MIRGLRKITVGIHSGKMIRERVKEALKQALAAGQVKEIAVLRLIMAALKDRDGVVQAHGQRRGVEEGEIIKMLNKMVRQRHESSAMYEQEGRINLAEQEADEIKIIEHLLPVQLSDEEITIAVNIAIRETGATCVKDIGRTMAILKSRYTGRMDFSRANMLVKRALCGQLQ